MITSRSEFLSRLTSPSLTPPLPQPHWPGTPPVDLTSSKPVLEMCPQAMLPTLLSFFPLPLSGRGMSCLVPDAPPSSEIPWSLVPLIPNLLAPEKEHVQRLVTARGFIVSHFYLSQLSLLPSVPTPSLPFRGQHFCFAPCASFRLHVSL